MIKTSTYEDKNGVTVLILLLQKLLRAIDLKLNVKERQVFSGGYFYGCDSPQRHARDSIFLSKSSTAGSGRPIKVKNFAELDLHNSRTFFSPFTMACMMYDQKGFHGKKKTLVKASEKAFKQWKAAAKGENDKVYFCVKEPEEPESSGGGGSKPGTGKKF